MQSYWTVACLYVDKCWGGIKKKKTYLPTVKGAQQQNYSWATIKESCGVEDVYAFNILLAQFIQLQLVGYSFKYFLFLRIPCFHQGNVKAFFQRIQNRNLRPGHTMISITTLYCPELTLDAFWWIVKLITEIWLCNILERYSSWSPSANTFLSIIMTVCSFAEILRCFWLALTRPSETIQLFPGMLGLMMPTA